MNRQFFRLSLLIVGCSFSTSYGITKDPIASLLLQRQSGYAYDPARTISPDLLEIIIKATQRAPSSYNDQPWRFIVCDRTTNPQSYQKVFDTLIAFNQEWVKNVPVLIVSIAATNSHNNEYNRWAQYDTGAAAFGMMIQATSLGLMAHQMGGFDPEKIKKVFNISDDFVPMSVMALGYAMQSETKSLSKERRPIEQNFFMGSWQAQ